MNTDFRRLLVVGPHPDDVELGCGGTIARFSRQASIDYLILSPCLEDPRNANIIAEAETAAGVLGIQPASMIVEDLPRRTFHDKREDIRRILIAARDRLAPDLVFCPSLRDVHQDHEVTAEEALRLFRDVSVVAYESPRSSLDFQPNLYLTLDEEQLETKVRALMSYKSQFDRYYFEPDIIRSFARMRGAQCRERYAEAFEIMRLKV
ncbi:MAG TPA: PIG-L deacetylase family protein [Candidatus Sulfotelmatobacter sp.]|nr:PIG-L deacetylase family protein [Candidatus Sulfotelmatobacter sp.]